MIATLEGRPPIISHPSSPMAPAMARVVEKIIESSNTATYRLQFVDPAAASAYRFRPGQFNMVYLFGVGEAAISISSDPDDGVALSHTIRHVGSVTFAINRLRIGETVGLRGPFGSYWPLEACRGRDILMVAGGILRLPAVVWLGIALLTGISVMLIFSGRESGRCLSKRQGGIPRMVLVERATGTSPGTRIQTIT